MSKEEEMILPRSLVGLVKSPTEAERRAIEQRVQEKVREYKKKVTEAERERNQAKDRKQSWTIPEKLQEMEDKLRAQNAALTK